VELKAKTGASLGALRWQQRTPFDTAGYEIVPTRQWASWCVSIYATRADLPLMTQSTLRTLAPRKEDAVTEAKQNIDHALAHLEDWLGN